MENGDYIEQEIRDVFCCRLKRPSLHIFRENNENEERKNKWGMGGAEGVRG